MWKKLAERHRQWEERSMRLLRDPASAEALPAGWQRDRHVKALNTMSAIERQQMLDFMERYRGWRSYAWIAGGLTLFSVLGLLASAVFPHKSVTQLIVAANLLGCTAAVAALVAWFNYRALVRKPLRIGLLFTGGCLLGVFTPAVVAGLESGQSLAQVFLAQSGVVYLSALGASIFFLGTVTVVSMVRNQQYESLTAQAQLDAERERSARIASESQLRLLRAQIEPHFLFNTLGAVQQLAENSSPRAAELTANLIAFLRASLDSMRRDSITLRDDFAMVAAYLQVMQVRMGPRLHYTLDLPAHLAEREVPSMMLLTLAENAIKHGIEPALRGGDVRVAAQEQDGVLHLCVRDSGVGLAEQPGSGEGLANIRQRLELAYGAAARLTLTENEEGGVAAEICLPLEPKRA